MYLVVRVKHIKSTRVQNLETKFPNLLQMGIA